MCNSRATSHARRSASSAQYAFVHHSASSARVRSACVCAFTTVPPPPESAAPVIADPGCLTLCVLPTGPSSDFPPPATSDSLESDGIQWPKSEGPWFVKYDEGIHYVYCALCRKYGDASHAGTTKHMNALTYYGVTPISFPSTWENGRALQSTAPEVMTLAASQTWLTNS